MVDWTSMGGAWQLLISDLGAWLYIFPGLIIGLVFGAMPGISVTMAMALFLPVTLYMEFFPAIIFLTSIYTGAGFGGAVPAVLMGIPGTSSAVATTFDGYPMAKQGLHNEALGYALSASTIGMFLSYLFLVLLIGMIAKVVLLMGPIELAVIALWGIGLLGSLSAGSVLRGLLVGVFGLLIGTIGINTAGYMRGTMGVPWLFDGVPLVPAIMGVLAAGQLIELSTKSYLVEDGSSRKAEWRRVVLGVIGAVRRPWVVLRGGLIGAFIGAIPGVGSSIANLISYSETRRFDSQPESFGKGNPSGVIAAESANSSSEGGAMATMLCLGIPGGGATAVLLAAFSMHGVVGGPQFIGNQLDTVYAILIVNIVQAPFLLLLGLVFVYFAGAIVRVPLRIVVPTVLFLTLLGAYAVVGNMSGPWTMLVFSVIGWIMIRNEYPVAAIVIGLMLGRLVETQLLRSYQLMNGDPTYILSRPSAVFLILLTVATMAFAIAKRVRKARKGADLQADLDAGGG